MTTTPPSISIEARPHRRSMILKCPTELTVVSTEMLIALAAEAPQTSRPAAAAGGHRPTRSRGGASVIDRARAYLAKLPPGIAGQNGSGATFRAAAALVQDLALSESDAWPLLCEFNERCEPPWSESDLRHRLDDAIKQPGERGRLLVNHQANGHATNGHTTTSTARILAVGTRVQCGDRDNIGDVVRDDGGSSVTVHFVSPSGNEADKNIPREQIKTADGSPVVPSDSPAIIIRPAGELIHEFPEMRPAILEGLLRCGETMNIIAAPKTGKSWLSMGLGLSVVTGVAQAASSRRVHGGAAQQPAAWVLCPGTTRGRSPPTVRRGSAGRCQRQRLGLHARSTGGRVPRPAARLSDAHRPETLDGGSCC